MLCCALCLFAIRFCRTNFVAQRPRLNETDVAPRDAKARHKTAKNITNIIQQPPIQCKVQHTGPAVLAATKTTSTSCCLRSLHQNQWVTESRTRLFDQTRSLAGSEIAPASRISIPRSENMRSNWSINHPYPRALLRGSRDAQMCSRYSLPPKQFLRTPHTGFPQS